MVLIALNANKHVGVHGLPTAAGHVHAYERTFPVNNYVVDPCGVRYLTVGDGGNIEGLYKTFAAQAGTCTCTSVQSAASANACPCLGVTPSFQPQVRRPPKPSETPFPTPHKKRCMLCGSAALVQPAAMLLLNPTERYCGVAAQRCATFQGTDPTGAPLWAPVNAAQPAFSAYRAPSFGHGILEILDDNNAQWTWRDTPPLPRIPSSLPSALSLWPGWSTAGATLQYNSKCVLPVLAPAGSQPANVAFMSKTKPVVLARVVKEAIQVACATHQRAYCVAQVMRSYLHCHMILVLSAVPHPGRRGSVLKHRAAQWLGSYRVESQTCFSHCAGTATRTAWRCTRTPRSSSATPPPAPTS